MKNAVHLQEVRCDGAAHGGCQAECLVFWKEAWLRRVDGPHPEASERDRRNGSSHDRDAVPGSRAVWAATRSSFNSADEAIYSCQATALPEATTWLPWWDVRQYLEDFTSGNASLWQLASGGVYVAYFGLVTFAARRLGRGAGALIRLYDRWQAAIGGTPYPRRYGTIPMGQKTPSRPLHLKPGDVVKVRTYDEILSTLDSTNRNRGMYFDAEEVPYCGQPARVRATVDRIIDEKTGKMITLKDHNVILEGVYCQARFSDRRMLCPRAIYSYWRETWLEKSAGSGE